MIKHIEEIEVLSGRPTSTLALFRESDLSALCTQPGATGRALIKFRHVVDGKIYDAAVAKGRKGLMLEPMNLVALPCPPVCPGGKYSFTPDCP